MKYRRNVGSHESKGSFFYLQCSFFTGKDRSIVDTAFHDSAVDEEFNMRSYSKYGFIHFFLFERFLLSFNFLEQAYF